MSDYLISELRKDADKIDDFTTGCDLLEAANVIEESQKKIASQDARIAELKSELAKLRRVIGEIPEGDSCVIETGKNHRTCKNGKLRRTNPVQHDHDCSLFDKRDIDYKRCNECLAAFPNGNKGE